MEMIWYFENEYDRVWKLQKSYPQYHVEWWEYRKRRLEIFESLWAARLRRYGKK